MHHRPRRAMSSDEKPAKISLSFKRHLNELTSGWKAALKRNKKLLLKCPNYEECQYKCSSIGGMQYHYERCSGTCPVFRCDACGKSYESRTGLNYHNTSSHGGDADAQGMLSCSDLIEDPDQEMEEDVEREEMDVKNWVEGLSDESAEVLASVPKPPPPSAPVRLKPGPKPGYKHLHKIKHGPPGQTRVARQPSVTSPKSPPIVKRRGPGRRPKHPKEDTAPVSPSPVSSTGLGPPASTADVLVAEGSSVKKITITIPSIEYPDKYRSYLPDWRDELKTNQTVKCPNFHQCQFQCTTVNGMKYHFIRCQKEKLPEFKCSLCTRSFHCRSGLVWHLKNSHKVDMQSNKKTVQVVMMEQESELIREAGVRGRRRRPLSTSLLVDIEGEETLKQSGRKSDHPRRTSESFLRQMRYKPNSSSSGQPKRVYPLPPVPRLHSPPCRSPVPPIEFLIYEAVPTDEDRHKSLVVDYSEEILTQWHKWYSDESESEESDEWEPEEGSSYYYPKGRLPRSPREGLDSSAMSVSSGPSNPVSEEDDLEGGDHSSDEDYSCTSYKPVARNRRGRRRGGSNVRNVSVATSAITSSAVAAAVKIVQRTPLEVGGTPSYSRLKPPPLKPIPPEESKIDSTKIKVAAKPLSSTSVFNTVKIASIAKPVQPVSVCKAKTKPVTLVKQTQPAHSIVLPQQQQQQPGSTQTVQYYQVPVQSMAATSGVIPMQVMSSVPGHQAAYQIPAGSLVLLQHPGGQAQYAMLQTVPAGAASRHVSVIMNPASGTDQTATAVPSAAPTNYSFITQLDGPKSTRYYRPRSTKQLRADFEAARRQARPLSSLSGPSRDPVEEIQLEPSSDFACQTLTVGHTAALDSFGPGMSLDISGGQSETVQGTHRSFLPLPSIPVSLPQASPIFPQQSILSCDWSERFASACSGEVGSADWLTSGEDQCFHDIMPSPSSCAATASSTSHNLPSQLARGFSPVMATGQPADPVAALCVGALQGTADQLMPTGYSPPPSATASSISVAGNSNNNGNEQATVSTGRSRKGKKRARSSNAVNSSGPPDSGISDAKVPALSPVDTAALPTLPQATMADLLPSWKKTLKARKFVLCDRCGSFKAKSLPSIKYHYQRCGQEVELIHCPICGESVSYKSKAGLQYHMKTAHVDPPPPTCSSPVDPVDLLAPRKAAEQANKKLNKISSMLTSLPPPSKNTENSQTSAASPAPPQNGSPENVSLSQRMHSCPFCPKVVTGRKRIANHLKIFHPNREVSDLSELEIVGEKMGAICKRALPMHELLQIKAEIKEKGMVACPHKNCSRTFKSHNGFHYHLTTPLHSFLICPVCSCMLPTWPKMEGHIALCHPGVQVEEKDLQPMTSAEILPKVDYGDSSSGDDENYVDEEERDWGVGTMRVSERKSRARQKFNSTAYGRVFTRVMNMMTSKDPVFPSWSPVATHFQSWSKSDVSAFLPVMKSSMQFSLSAEWPHSSSLDLFASHCPGSQDALFFTGGPIGAMDWVPVPNDHHQQYLALAAYKTVDETHPLQTAMEEPGLIQLWSLGDLYNKTDSTPCPVFEMGLAHTFGWAQDIAWCPSGAWEDPAHHTIESGVLPRLGLMCVAFSDGRARIFSLPHPDALRHSLSTSESTDADTHLIVTVSHIACTLTPTEVDTTQFGQCLCVGWMPQSGHGKIAAGFSNGTACIWDLLSFDTYLQAPGPVLRPQLVISAHSGPCRCLAWCPSQPNLIFTGGCDRMSCVWDLRQTSAPLQKFERYWLSECHWPPMWCGVYVVEDCFSAKLKSAGLSFFALMHLQSQGGLVHHSCVSSSAPILSLSYCKWTNTIASASLHGEVKSNNFNYTFYNTPSPRFTCKKQTVLFSCSLKSLLPDGDVSDERDPVYGEVTMSDLCHSHKLVFSDKASQMTYSHSIVPLMAVTKVRWNPCEKAHQWLVCGANSGLVRLLRVTNKKFHQKQSFRKN